MFAVLGVLVDFSAWDASRRLHVQPAHLARKSESEVARLGKFETSSEGGPGEKQRAAARPNSGPNICLRPGSGTCSAMCSM